MKKVLQIIIPVVVNIVLLIVSIWCYINHVIVEKEDLIQLVCCIVSSFVTFYVLFISTSQTADIQNQNTSFHVDNFKASNYSSIRFLSPQCFVIRDDNCYLLKLKYYDENNKPLSSMKVKRIDIQKSNNINYGYKLEPGEIKIIETKDSNNLERTPKQKFKDGENIEYDYYYSYIEINKSIFDVIKDNDYFKFDIEFEVSNIFGIMVSQTSHLMFKKTEVADESNPVIMQNKNQIEKSYEIKIYREFIDDYNMKYIDVI